MTKYNPAAGAIWKDLNLAWNGVQAQFQRMNRSSSVRPQSASEVFTTEAIDEGGVRVEARPTVFNVPEKVNGAPALYIVLRGWVDLKMTPADASKLVTQEFSTEVAYFRITREDLRHVYGAHYDMDMDLPGHPVFHAQIKSQARLGDYIQERYRDKRPAGRDHIEGVLNNVRTPTPQMDVFSVVTQIAADHLISEDSQDEPRQAFEDLRRACDFFVGAGRDVWYLNREETSGCMRSTHWYERDEAVNDDVAAR